MIGSTQSVRCPGDAAMHHRGRYERSSHADAPSRGPDVEMAELRRAVGVGLHDGDADVTPRVGGDEQRAEAMHERGDRIGERIAKRQIGNAGINPERDAQLEGVLEQEGAPVSQPDRVVDTGHSQRRFGEERSHGKGESKGFECSGDRNNAVGSGYAQVSTHEPRDRFQRNDGRALTCPEDRWPLSHHPHSHHRWWPAHRRLSRVRPFVRR